MEKTMWYEFEGNILYGPVVQHSSGYWHTKEESMYMRKMVNPFETPEEALKHARIVYGQRAKTAMDMFHKAIEKKKKFIDSCK